MFARVSIIEGSPDQIDEGTRLVRDQILPRARELSGFKGVVSLADRSTGKGLTITLWESEEAMRATEQEADRLRQDAAQTVGGRIAGVERYEVTVLEV